MYRIEHSDEVGAPISRPQAGRRPKFAFLVNGEGQTLESLRQSNLASVRMRVCLAAQAFESLGAEVVFCDGELPEDVTHVVVTKPDLLLDDSREQRWTEALVRAQRQDSRILVDFCDNHFARVGPLGDFYRWLIPLAARVICNSEKNAAVVAQYKPSGIRVIEDPVELTIREPRKGGGLFTTLLWFGHRSNLPYLISFLVDDFRPPIPVKLICLTNGCPVSPEIIKHISDYCSPVVDLAFVEWSLVAMRQAAELCNGCIIPAGFNDPKKAGASSNRLLTALALGLPVAADGVPAYDKFKKYFVPLRGADFDDFCFNPEDFQDRVLLAQQKVLPNYTIEKLTKEWLKAAKEFSLIPL